mmetsp:Transcript_77863/g.166990  ORF Transcript_77863/g.166990 Transcript_77863/m.166990 type:complete len:860 (-) Transcript_77863:76-2655(-)
MGAAQSDRSGQDGSQCCAVPEEQVQLLAQHRRMGGNEEQTSVASVVQFTCAIYYCTEAEGEALIDVARLGDAMGVASFEYHTEDASAKAGKKYQASSGLVTFEPGETTKELRIPVIMDESWNATLEFNVVIRTVKGAQMGKYLNRCRVRLIDADTFPSSKFEDLLKGGREDEIKGISLMMEYLKLMWKNDVVRVDTIKAIILDQMFGIHFFLTTYLQMYLIDVVLAPKEEGEGEGMEGEGGEGGEGIVERRLLLTSINATAAFVARVLGEEEGEEGEEAIGLMPEALLIPGHRKQTALVIGIMYVVPFILLHLIDQYKCFIAIPGEARKALQANLMRKFLNYKEHVRSEIAASEITMAMIRDVTEVVDKGYMKVLEIFKIIGKLSCALIFILLENRMGVVPLFVYPLVLGAWLCCRERKTIDVNEEKAKRQDMFVQTTDEAVRHCRLVSDFHLRTDVNDRFEQNIDDFHAQESRACSVVTNNLYVAPWCTTLFIGTYMALGVHMVNTVGGTISLGTFLATINVFKEIGCEIEEVYAVCMEIQLSFGPLQKITHLLNLETDLLELMAINRKRRKEGHEKRHEMRDALSKTQFDPGAFAVDSVPIRISNLTFSYQSSHAAQRGMPHAEPLLKAVNASFEQGKLYAFVGPPHEGKGTILKLLGQAINPAEGEGDIFVPPHLRILHVTRDASIMQHTHKTFLENVLLGGDIVKMGGMERLRRICKRVGFSKEIIGHLGGDFNSAPPAPETAREWASKFSQTDFARLNLVRVFAMNPEVLAIHKPAVYFDDRERIQITGLLREHVDQRGIELPSKDRAFRRPRTVFFTSSTAAGVKEADMVYKVSTKDGLCQIKKESVSTSWLG